MLSLLPSATLARSAGGALITDQQSVNMRILQPTRVSTDGIDLGVIVMLHTMWRSGDMYVESDYCAHYLGDATVLAPDLLGHGASVSSSANQPTTACCIERHAAAIANAILKTLPRGTAVTLFGYSVSGTIALATARILLELGHYCLRGIILVVPVIVFQCADFPSPVDDTSASTSSKITRSNNNSSIGRRIIPMPSFIRNRLLARFCNTNAIQTVIFARLMSTRTIDHQQQPDLATDPDAVHTTIQSTMKWCPNASSSAIRRAQLPVMIIDAERDTLRSNDPQRKMLLRLLGTPETACRIVAPQSEHALLKHEPDFVYSNVARFLRQIAL